MIYLISSLGLLIAFCLGMMVRNEMVYKYRMGLNKRVGEASTADILNGREWRWRFNELSAVTYNDMMWQFWKPIDSFYTEDPAREV